MSDIPVTKPTISIPPDFTFGAVDPMATATPELLKARNLQVENLNLANPTTVGTHGPIETAKGLNFPFPFPFPFRSPLGPLASFTGSWVGHGFNTIFRPNNKATPTKLPIPVTGDNILELNLTLEQLDFSPSLGSVPNRGTDPQGDVTLNGIPYLQTVTDITTGLPGVGIHVEPGLWMLSPTSTHPAIGQSVTRMGSIPHGTTIQAQGFSFEVNGPPQISPVDITPTFRAGGAKIRFASQTAAQQGTPRIPQDLSSFIASGLITQAILDDPNKVIRDHIAGLNITHTTVLAIATNPALLKTLAPPPPQPPTFGGGTDNIAFLAGDAAGQNPNANAIQLTAIFWIETVSATLNVPAFASNETEKLVPLPAKNAGQPVPTFLVKKNATNPGAHTINVTYKQIQYTQNVILVFAPLNWPHVSNATLVPKNPIPVQA